MSSAFNACNRHVGNGVFVKSKAERSAFIPQCVRERPKRGALISSADVNDARPALVGKSAELVQLESERRRSCGNSLGHVLQRLEPFRRDVPQKSKRQMEFGIRFVSRLEGRATKLILDSGTFTTHRFVECNTKKEPKHSIIEALSLTKT